jgi:hypothetical protein
MTTISNTKAKTLTAMGEKIYNINLYVQDGFKKVCDVRADGSTWVYKNIDRDIMFSDHTSWVYFIVHNDIIKKVGETGNPLGIKEVHQYVGYERQPISSSKCRFGRLRNGDGTDEYIRSSLNPYINAGQNVSLWAKKCNTVTVTESISGWSRAIETSSHKALELMYLNYFKDEVGYLPELNKAKK